MLLLLENSVHYLCQVITRLNQEFVDYLLHTQFVLLGQILIVDGWREQSVALAEDRLVLLHPYCHIALIQLRLLLLGQSAILLAEIVRVFALMEAIE